VQPSLENEWNRFLWALIEENLQWRAKISILPGCAQLASSSASLENSLFHIHGFMFHKPKNFPQLLQQTSLRLCVLKKLNAKTQRKCRLVCLLLVFGEDDSGVMAAKSKGIGKGNVHC
jgi:hypothetical protein